MLFAAFLLWGLAVLAGQHFDKLLQLAEQRYGAKARATVAQWQSMIEHASDGAEPRKLMLANDFFNQRIRFADDEAIWGRADYWATPLETMGLAQGDCEDFSIAKYVSLLQMGVPLHKLRLIYVKAHMGGGRSQAHMVLAYYAQPGAEPLILDNLSVEILPASRRRDLVPVFSFNSAGLWVGDATEPKVSKPETRLSRWRDVLARMQAEGIH